MSQVSPSQIFQEVAAAIPESCRGNIVIIGSIAAGYHFFGDDTTKVVRTKDIDCVLEPFNVAVHAGETIATQLLEAGWKRRLIGEHQKPGTSETPTNQLPAIRLYPPDANPNSEEAWFVEFLTVPKNSKSSEKEWTRLSLPQGDFGLPTFRYLSLTAFDPLPAGDLGIRYARTELMALSNMLAHPSIGSETMSSPIAGESIKRANKDLGRVLAITTLADLDDYRPWADTWKSALKTVFPDDWQTHALNAGSGFRELLSSPSDLNEALHTCTYGLLNSNPVSINALIAAGQRLEADAIETLESYAR
jgi:hypothetical protein